MFSLPDFFARRHRLRLAVTGIIAVAGAIVVAIAVAVNAPADKAPADKAPADPALADNAPADTAPADTTPAPTAAVAGPIADTGPANATPASTKWDRLAQCESSGNWTANTGNGFSGGLQFTASTWRAYGGQGKAHSATRTEQITVAERVLADQGWDAWPACSAKLGLA